MTRYLLTRMQSGIVCFEVLEAGIKPHSVPRTFRDWTSAAGWLSSLGISDEQLIAANQVVTAGYNATVSVLQ